MQMNGYRVKSPILHQILGEPQTMKRIAYWECSSIELYYIGNRLGTTQPMETVQVTRDSEHSSKSQLNELGF